MNQELKDWVFQQFKDCEDGKLDETKKKMFLDTVEQGKHIPEIQEIFAKYREEEEEYEYEFNIYGFNKVYKIVMQVAGGGMGNGNAYATIEGEWACEDDFNNGEDGKIYYCEYGPNPKRDYRGNRLIFNDEGTAFNIE